jgi:hypothetical protein
MGHGSILSEVLVDCARRKIEHRPDPRDRDPSRPIGRSRVAQKVTEKDDHLVLVAGSELRRIGSQETGVDALAAPESGLGAKAGIDPETPRNTGDAHCQPSDVRSSERNDDLEDALHAKVCDGTMLLADAQLRIARDWVAAWEAAGRP